MAEPTAEQKLALKLKLARAAQSSQASEPLPEQSQAAPAPVQAPTAQVVDTAPGQKRASEATALDWVKQPLAGAHKTVMDIYDLGLTGAETMGGITNASDLATMPDEERAQKAGSMGPWEAYGSLLASFLRQQAGAERAQVERPIQHRDMGKGAQSSAQDRAADALYTFGEWSLPIGKATKLDPVIGTFATLGEQALGEKGELAGLLPVGASLVRTGMTATRDAVDKLSKIDMKKITGWFGDQFHDYSSALRALKESVNAGQVGDIADLTRDPGAANIVGGVPRGSPTDVKLNQIEQAVEAQTGELAKGAFKQGDPLAAQEAARQTALARTMEARQAGERGAAEAQAANLRQQEQLLTDPMQVAQDVGGKTGAQLSESLAREQAAQQGLPEAIQAQREAMTRIEPVGSASETSMGLARSIEEQKATLKAGLTEPAWKKFDNSKQIDATQLSDMLREKLLENWSKGDVDQLFGRPELRTLIEMEGKQRPKDMGNIVSRLKKAAADQKTDDSWKGILTDAARSMDDAVSTLGNTKAWTEAKAATVRMKELLGDKPVSRARAKTVPETLGNELFRPKEQGAVTAKAMLETVRDPKFGTPKILDAMEEHILAKAADEGLDDAFLNKYDEFLSSWRTERPEFVSRLEDAVASEQRLSAKAQKIEETQLVEEKKRSELVKALNQAKAEKETAKAARLTKAVEQSQLTAYSKKPKATIEKALLEKEGNQFQALSNAFKSPEDKANFSAQVGEVVQDLAKRPGGLSKNADEYARLQERVKNVVGDEGMAKLAEVQSREAFQRLKNRAGSAKYRDDPGAVAEDVASSVGVLAFMKAVKVDNALLIGGAVRRTIKKLVRGTKELERERQIAAILDRFITEPDSFLKAVEGGQVTSSKLEQFVETWMKEATRKNTAGQVAKGVAIETQGEE